MTEKRVCGDYTVSDGLLDHGLQTYCEIYDGSRSQAAFGTQVQIIFLDEGKVQRSKRDVRHFVLRPDELLQMAVCVPVAGETFGRAVYSYPLFEIADELHEIAQQCFLSGSHAEQPLLHILGADTITYGRQLGIDAKRSCPYLI